MMNHTMDLCKGQKTIMRQFLILKKLGDVPDQVNLEHVKDFLLREAEFGSSPHHVLSRPMLVRVENKIFSELEKEQRLSNQFGRKVTLEGLEMFLGMIRPPAEAEVRKLLLPLFSNLACRAGLDMNSKQESSPPAGDAGSPNEQVPSTSTLLQTAEKLVPELVTATFSFLLEDREEHRWRSLFSSEQSGLTSMEGQWAEASIDDVFRLVEDAASSVLTAQNVPAPGSITRRVVKDMVAAIFQKFEHALISFQLIGHDSTEFDGLAVTRSIISVIADEMEMGDWETDEPETFSNQKCENTTTPATPEVSLKDLLLRAARDFANNNNNVRDGFIVKDDLPEAASAQARGLAGVMEDFLQEPVVAHHDDMKKAVITEVTSDQVQASPRSPKTTAASRFSEETLNNLLEVEAPKLVSELSDEKPSVVISCVLANTLDLQHPMTIQVLDDVCRDVAEEDRGVSRDLLKKPKKGGVRGFIRRVRKWFSCCCCCCGLPKEGD